MFFSICFSIFHRLANPQDTGYRNAWTHGYFARRRNSQDSPTAPGSGAATNQNTKAVKP